MGVALWPPRETDLVLGVDLDGFMWARRRALPFVASLKGIIADELRNERGWVRVLLSVQARWERRNVERADLVVVTSRYSAEVAQREYGVPLERIAVVPEPIDLEVWDDQFWRAPRRPRGGGPTPPPTAKAPASPGTSSKTLQAGPSNPYPSGPPRTRHQTIQVITPTGHTYTSRPPPALGPGSTPPDPLDHWNLHRPGAGPT